MMQRRMPQNSARPARTFDLLPGLPRKPLTPQQQTEALQRVQAQAEQRVKLGMQLFKAAEAHVAQHRDTLAQIKAEQDRLRTEIQDDVTKTLHQYDQWVGQIDESFTKAIHALTERLDRLEAAANASQARLESMVRRAEALLDQARLAMETPQPQNRGTAKAADTAAATPPPKVEPEVPRTPRIYSQLMRRLRDGGSDAQDKAA